MKILVTGGAGFIGFHVSKQLLNRGDSVVGLDNFSTYYDVSLKEARLAELEKLEGDFSFARMDIRDSDALDQFCAAQKPDAIIHLAAQAGVRYSIDHPQDVIDNNVAGFMNVLEQARKLNVSHFVYASSSSVYGSNEKVPFSVSDNVDHPISMYAASKKANELMAHVYSHLYGLPSTGLRFFTVYGPWGRPDMAAYLFADAIYEKRPIKLFNYGNHSRDFTFVDDIVTGILSILDRQPEGAPPYAVYNIGHKKPEKLLDFIECLEDSIGLKAATEGVPMQAGDVETTYADIDPLIQDFDYHPGTPIREGIAQFIDWYKSYHGMDS
ncbi:MAG TPA: capsular biosynthesis protein CpsI [Gammaproteobacteria bacterium]|nr:capsular biosynthesis protein CpsI [Gammaproteobacteria bacterium]